MGTWPLILQPLFDSNTGRHCGRAFPKFFTHNTKLLVLDLTHSATPEESFIVAGHF